MILSNAVLVTLFTSLPSLVDGHAFMKIPTSRNQYAVQIGTSWEMKEGIPLAESTPQGLNHNLNICGREGALGNDYDLWLDSTGVPMPFVAQDTFTKGQVIDVNIVIKAHHMGHFEIKACAMGRDSTQECFDANPLEFMADVTHGMPKDKNNPVRAMLWGDGKDIMYKYKLPDNLAGDQVLLQYIYWTANNCNYEGYDEYYAAHDTPPTSSKNSWSPGIPNCKPQEQISLYRDERTTGAVDGVELFFNCAEIAITGEPTPTPPVAPPSPRPPPPVPVPVQSPVQSPIEPGITGTCGQGDRGNAVCLDHSLCCSKWGHCGTGSGYCDDGSDNTTPTSPVPAPVQAPVDSTPTTTGENHDLGESRLIAYIGNWQDCPTDEQIAQYTHIVIAFAVTYTWRLSGNVCSETCEIAAPPVCENADHPELIQKWKAAGKKIILSFGGAGMGGSWAGDNNDCWDYCFGRETQVVDRLTEIVSDMGIDGIDIDYEYFYENNQGGSGFTKGAEAQKFLEDVTVGLRSSMHAGSELTHAPMEPDVVPGTAYFTVLKKVASSLDFLMPQYYNGYVQSLTNFPGALKHFTDITEQMFDGDASKVVYGFCISDCSSFNLDGYESADVMEKISDTYPCNGGAFFWVAYDDTNGSWSKPMEGQLGLNSATCADPDRPVPPPVSSPVSSPVQAPSPVVDPGSPGVPGGSTGGGGGGSSSNGCCSQNYKSCADWGNDSKEVCEGLGGGMVWLENGAVDDCNLGRYNTCTSKPTECCPGLICVGNQHFKQCEADTQ